VNPIRLHGLCPEDLVAALAARGAELSLLDARRSLDWLLAQGREDLDHPALRISRRSRRALLEHTLWRGLEVEDRERDAVDGSLRLLFRAHDGARFEGVLIGLERQGRHTACLSSQVGCPLDCAFCATGRLGFRRQLEPWEMVASFCALRAEAQGRVTGAVFMGQGEPFLNYEGVMQAAAVLSHPNGARVAKKSISISSAGWVPGIRRFTEDGHKFRLVVSLTSAIPARRQELMPAAARWTHEDLGAALRAYCARSGRRVTLAWVLLGGVNHDQAEVEALAALCRDARVRISLLDVNDNRPDGFRRATDAEREDFRDRLQALGVPIVRRYSVGLSSDAACGMLAAKAVGKTSG
jgi:23S rRNA (adenine2503-C2)-methyltransferase